jgi:hypothetical protein
MKKPSLFNPVPGLAYAAGFLLVLRLCDILVEQRPWGPYAWWGPIDSLFHGVIAALAVAPLALADGGQGAWRFPWLAGLVATLLDIDHFVAAGSLSLWAATHLPCRPPTHSFTFALLAALLASFASPDRRWSFAIGAAIGSHALRDAAGGGCTPVLFPLAPVAVPYPIYLAGTVGLGWFAEGVEKHRRSAR